MPHRKRHMKKNALISAILVLLSTLLCACSPLQLPEGAVYIGSNDVESELYMDLYMVADWLYVVNKEGTVFFVSDDVIEVTELKSDFSRGLCGSRAIPLVRKDDGNLYGIIYKKGMFGSYELDYYDIRDVPKYCSN